MEHWDSFCPVRKFKYKVSKQEEQNFVYLNDFVQFLTGTNFAGGAFKFLSASAKINSRQTIRNLERW